MLPHESGKTNPLNALFSKHTPRLLDHMALCCRRRRRRNRSRFPFVIQIGQMPQISRYLPLPILLPLLSLFSIKFASQHASYNLSAFSVILADHLSIISKRNLHTQNFRTQNLHTRSDLRIPTVPETRVLISSLARRDISIDSLCENLPKGKEEDQARVAP